MKSFEIDVAQNMEIPVFIPGDTGDEVRPSRAVTIHTQKACFIS